MQPACRTNANDARHCASDGDELHAGSGTAPAPDSPVEAPVASRQFPMHPWSLRFRDAKVELAHKELRAASLIPMEHFVLALVNSILIIVYCLSFCIGCRNIQNNFPQFIVLKVSIQAFELYLHYHPQLAEAIHSHGMSVPFRVFYAGAAFTFFNMIHYWSDRSEASLGSAYSDLTDNTSMCTAIGLSTNGTVVLCTILIPYVSHMDLSFKVAMAMTMLGTHTLAPLWNLPEGMETLSIVINIIVGNLMGYFIEHSLRSTFREQYARRADQELLMQMKVASNLRLTHTIKGKCGTANSLAFAVIACLEHIRIEQVECAVQLLRRMRFILNEAEWWCNQRQLCVHLELGTYRSKRSPCDIDTRLRQIIGTDGVVEHPAEASCHLDEVVFGLAIDEALNNSRQFRNPKTQIVVSAQVHEDGDASMLRVDIDSVNHPKVPPLSAEQCLRVVRSDYKKHSAAAFSDGVGLASVQRAAQAVGGRIWLHCYSTTQPSSHVANLRVNHTVFHLLIPVDTVTRRYSSKAGACSHRLGSESDSELDQASHPSQTVPPTCNDASDSETSAPGWPLPEPRTTLSASVFACGGASSEVGTFDMPALLFSHELARTAPLYCLGLDDSSMCRQLHELLFSTFIKADMSRSASIGCTADEVDHFADVALGLLTHELKVVPAGEKRAADVVIIDQHIHVGHRRWLGLDIASRLRSRGFKGVVCLTDGTDANYLRALQRDCVEVDLAFSKSETPARVTESIIQMHLRKRIARRF